MLPVPQKQHRLCVPSKHYTTTWCYKDTHQVIFATVCRTFMATHAFYYCMDDVNGVHAVGTIAPINFPIAPINFKKFCTPFNRYVLILVLVLKICTHSFESITTSLYCLLPSVFFFFLANISFITVKMSNVEEKEIEIPQ